MSLASRITDVIDAIATAVNARNAPGASDYQQWLAQGNTGTIDNYRASILGADMDFATQFNTAIGATPTAKIATEAQAGLTQLATLAEAQAANSAKALSPGRLRGMLIATSLADLNAKAQVVPDGWVIALTSQDFGGTNGTLFRSIWGVLGGYARPIVPLMASRGETLSYLNSVIGLPARSFPNIVGEPGVTRALIARATTNLYDEFMFVGTTGGFVLWTGLYTNWSFQSPTTNRSGVTSSITLAGEWVNLHIAGNAQGTAIAQFGVILTAGTDIKPFGTLDSFMGGAVNSNGWQPLTYYMAQGDTTLRPLTAQIPANTDFGVSAGYRRAIPTG